jgi:hypothetical protein
MCDSMFMTRSTIKEEISYVDATHCLIVIACDFSASKAILLLPHLHGYIM